MCKGERQTDSERAARAREWSARGLSANHAETVSVTYLFYLWVRVQGNDLCNARRSIKIEVQRRVKMMFGFLIAISKTRRRSDLTVTTYCPLAISASASTEHLPSPRPCTALSTRLLRASTPLESSGTLHSIRSRTEWLPGTIPR